LRLLLRRALRSALRTLVGVPFGVSSLAALVGVANRRRRFDLGVALNSFASPDFFRMDRGVPCSAAGPLPLLDGVWASSSLTLSSSTVCARSFRGLVFSASCSSLFRLALTMLRASCGRRREVEGAYSRVASRRRFIVPMKLGRRSSTYQRRCVMCMDV
jgi:hypothetical protein